MNKIIIKRKKEISLISNIIGITKEEIQIL